MTEIKELDMEVAKEFHKFVTQPIRDLTGNNVLVCTQSNSFKFGVASRIYFSPLGIIGFLGIGKRDVEDHGNVYFNLTNIFESIAIPQQLINFYRTAADDTEKLGVEDILSGWHNLNTVEMNEPLKNHGFKKHYTLFQDKAEQIYRERGVFPFSQVYVPELEVRLWQTMDAVETGYRQKLGMLAENARKGNELISQVVNATAVIINDGNISTPLPGSQRESKYVGAGEGYRQIGSGSDNK